MVNGDTPQDWTVSLMVDSDTGTEGVQEGPIGNLSSIIGANPTNPRATEWDFGGSAKGTGTWEATFHGADATLTADTDLPMAVDGTFNAMVPSFAQITGGFGASMPDDDN